MTFTGRDMAPAFAGRAAVSLRNQSGKRLAGSGRKTANPLFAALVRTLCLVCVFVWLGAPLRAAQLRFDKPAVDVDWSSAPQRPGAPVAAGPFRKDRLFGTVEFRSKIKNMPKWQRVANVYHGRSGIDDCFAAAGRSREERAWRALKDKVRGASNLEKAKSVNTFFNQWPYRTDREAYGVSDYWANPAEFIKNSGDCEDYAITKFYALKQLGVPVKDMRVVILRDHIRNIDHAVLAVYIGDSVHILDNVTNMVLVHDNFKHYQPYFSVNDDYRWAHVPPS